MSRTPARSALPAPPPRHTGSGFGYVLLVVTLAISDFTIADAVIPSIVRDLNLSLSDLGRSFTAYFATAAAFMVLM
ncbi:MAG: hypothetical protein M3Y83_03910, partial [Actinomycetota bacterium]|nr:hypothetical protein [Actinomycetota bacterium]